MAALPHSLNDDPVSHINDNLASHLCFRCGWFAFTAGNGIISLCPKAFRKQIYNQPSMASIFVGCFTVASSFEFWDWMDCTSIVVGSFHPFFAGDCLFNRSTL
ncbi:uncharacterized protein LOC108342323 [Vigna angularis]|uniref:uncharacterized protein LOC108342323 n=1 Tax=Phaseolus angularis TaxID=3914 RepID=UPI0022B3D7AA|nr:uncharacterized protein LOC108342323 [Vigna angularis]